LAKGYQDYHSDGNPRQDTLEGYAKEHETGANRPDELSGDCYDDLYNP